MIQVNPLTLYHMTRVNPVSPVTVRRPNYYASTSHIMPNGKQNRSVVVNLQNWRLKLAGALADQSRNVFT